MTMNSSRPYIIRALYDWILENECTPYILVDAFGEGVEVPQDHVKDGQIILNISPKAVQSASISNDAVEFNGRFGGIPKRVLVPIKYILGIYAKENGQGMIFDPESAPPEPPEPTTPEETGTVGPSEKKGSPKPALRIVK